MEVAVLAGPLDRDVKGREAMESSWVGASVWMDARNTPNMKKV